MGEGKCYNSSNNYNIWIGNTCLQYLNCLYEICTLSPWSNCQRLVLLLLQKTLRFRSLRNLLKLLQTDDMMMMWLTSIISQFPPLHCTWFRYAEEWQFPQSLGTYFWLYCCLVTHTAHRYEVFSRKTFRWHTYLGSAGGRQGIRVWQVILALCVTLLENMI